MDPYQPPRQSPSVVDKVRASVNPLNFTIVYIMIAVGVFFALLITIITYAVIPSTKVDPVTKQRRSNVALRIAVTFVVLIVSLLICGGLGYHQGMKISVCWANPKYCAMTTGAGMLFDIFD